MYDRYNHTFNDRYDRYVHYDRTFDLIKYHYYDVCYIIKVIVRWSNADCNDRMIYDSNDHNDHYNRQVYTYL